MFGRLGIASQCPNARQRAGLVPGAALASGEQFGVGRKDSQQLCKPARREPVLSADARALSQSDAIFKFVFGEMLAGNLQLFFKADRPAGLMGAELKEDLICDVVVRPQKHLFQDDRQRPRLCVNVNRFQPLRHCT